MTSLWRVGPAPAVGERFHPPPEHFVVGVQLSARQRVRFNITAELSE